MSEKFYVVISWYSGEGNPEVSFHPDADGAISATREATRSGADVTVYAVSDLPRLVTGPEIRREQS